MIRQLALLLSVCIAQACQPQPDYQQHAGGTMGTYYQVTCRCPGQPVTTVAAVISATLDAVNAAMSTYDPTSEISRFNEAPVDHWVAVSPAFAEVASAATSISDRTEGAFDATVAPLVDLWGFGPAGHQPEPADAALAAARARVDYRLLDIRQDPPMLRKRGAIRLDLSAIAKGYGVDAVTAALRETGCTDLLVDIGGEVRAAGSSPRGGVWRIGIEVPEPDSYGAIQSVVGLSDRSVATSGNYRNFIDGDSGRRGHTIDPRTGQPAQHDMASVSVMHESAMLADAWATAFMVLGPEATERLALVNKLPVLMILHSAAGFETRYNSLWPGARAD